MDEAFTKNYPPGTRVLFRYSKNHEWEVGTVADTDCSHEYVSVLLDAEKGKPGMAMPRRVWMEYMIEPYYGDDFFGTPTDQSPSHVMGLSPETIDPDAYDDFMRNL